jgi:hypothetical protein
VTWPFRRKLVVTWRPHATQPGCNGYILCEGKLRGRNLERLKVALDSGWLPEPYVPTEVPACYSARTAAHALAEQKLKARDKDISVLLEAQKELAADELERLKADIAERAAKGE